MPQHSLMLHGIAMLSHLAHAQQLTGRCSEAERDRIEEQVGLFVRRCTENISRLEASVQQQQQQQQQTGASRGLNPHVAAHRLGVVPHPSPFECCS